MNESDSEAVSADDPQSAAESATRGTIRSQEPGVTRPRPATVAEARARDKARAPRDAPLSLPTTGLLDLVLDLAIGSDTRNYRVCRRVTRAGIRGGFDAVQHGTELGV